MEFHLAALLIALGIYSWYCFSQAREQAILNCKQACQQLNVQLLDDSIVLKKISLTGLLSGPLRLYRHYQFDFSIHGSDRYHGYIYLQGMQPQGVQFDHPDGKIFLENNVTQSLN